MNLQTAIKALESCGTAQNRKVYFRHGVNGDMFGVSWANLYTMAKKIKTDHSLAVKLWRTGNHDARVPATMVADPQDLDSKTVDAWVKDVEDYVVAGAFTGLVGKSRFARARAVKWAKSTQEFIGQIGWGLVGGLAMYADDIEPAYFKDRLQTIEREIHKRKNRTKHAMNLALCAIGIGRDALRTEAIAVAKRIGRVDVDHGETSCKTPDAAAFIQEAAARKKKQRTATRK